MIYTYGVGAIVNKKPTKTPMHTEEKEECEFCGGIDGEHEDITTMEQVWPGEPHMAPIGTQPCPMTQKIHEEVEDYQEKY
jgi:hypothetical protein